MFKFILNITIISTLVVLTFVVSGVRLQRQKEHDYLAAIIDKHSYLKRHSGKRLILAGGSNLSFGINSPLIESSTNIPVINLGLHGGLGLDFMLNELKSIMREGDAIFLSIEFLLNDQGHYMLKKELTEFSPESKAYYSIDYLEEVKGWLIEKHNGAHDNFYYIISLLEKENRKNTMVLRDSPAELDTFNIYKRKNFNSNGDMIGHLSKKSPEKISKYKIKYRYYEGIEKLNSFYKIAQSKKIKVYFLYPTFPESQYATHKDVIKQYDTDLRNDLKIPIINKPDSFVFNDSLFFDTVYHLNKLGREVRTKKLLKIIKKYVPPGVHASTGLSCKKSKELLQNVALSEDALQTSK